MPDLTDAERERIEALTQALVRKLLDQPTRSLRDEAGSHRAPEYAAMARRLFNLSAAESNSSATAAD
jgi:glutamyl-tRNA reductase